MIEQLFFTYILIAVAYNLANTACKELTGKQLSPSEPLPSITMLAALYLIFLSNGIGQMPAEGPGAMQGYVRSFLLLAFALMIFRFGILRHLFNYDRSLYLSSSSRVSAAVINIFGLSLLVASLIQVQV